MHGSARRQHAPRAGGRSVRARSAAAASYDTYGVAYAILILRTFCNIHPDPDFAAAIASAFNEWLSETWLSRAQPRRRFKGSITVAQQDPR